MILLTCIGVTMVLQHGSILNYPRNLVAKIPLIKKLIECSLCLGLWVGLGMAYANYRIDGNLFESACIPFASACGCWLFDSLIDFLQLNSIDLKTKPSVKQRINN